MKKLLILVTFLAGGCAIGQVDWPVYRGNAQRTGAQRREQILRPASLNKLQLLWTRRLGQQALTAPAILGRLISHRGFQELVFIGNAAGDVFAIDDDLNRILWTRRLPQNAHVCGAGLTAAPLFPPLPRNAMDSDEDNPYAMRPLYVLSSDGKLYKLNPMTGGDISAPVSFVPPNAKVSNLNYSNKVIYTTTSGGCGGVPDAVWAFDTTTGAIASYRAPDMATISDAGVTIGTDGTIYALSENVIALSAKDLKLKHAYAAPGSTHVTGIAVFNWQARDIVAAYGSGLFLLDGKNVGEVQAISVDGLAISKNPTGKPWLYAASKAGGIVAFTVEDRENHLVLQRAWDSQRNASTAPVVANGVVYALSTQGNRSVLYALDASTGREIYASRDAVDSRIGNSGLAVANGHVCFGMQNGTLYCYGLPIDL